MPTNPSAAHRDVLVALIGSKPLVVYVDDWVPGVLELVTHEGEQIVHEGEDVVTVVV